MISGVGTLPAGDETALAFDLDRAGTLFGYEAFADDVVGRIRNVERAFVDSFDDYVAVDEIEVVIADPVAKRIQNPARAEDLGLVNGAAAVRGAPLLDLIVKIVAVYRDILDAPRSEKRDDPGEHRLAPDGHKRFGADSCKRSKARTQSRSKHYGLLCVHNSRPFLNQR